MKSKNFCNAWHYFIIILISVTWLGSCATKNTVKDDNQDFYKLAQRAKSSLKGQDYKNWLNNQLRHKQSELASMDGQKEREMKLMGHHEAMTESSALNGNQQDIHQFKAQRRGQALKRMDDRKRMLERHIFYLNSQLSELDGPKQ